MNNTPCISFTASCADGDIQLVDGESEWKGTLQVCFNQRWGTVNGEGWDSTETEVVCRELGYQSSGMSFIHWYVLKIYNV